MCFEQQLNAIQPEKQAEIIGTRNTWNTSILHVYGRPHSKNDH